MILEIQLSDDHCNYFLPFFRDEKIKLRGDNIYIRVYQLCGVLRMILLLSVLTNFRQSRIFGGYSKVTTSIYDLLIFITPTTAGIRINKNVNKKYQAEFLSNTPPSGCWLIDLFYCQNDDDFIRRIEKSCHLTK